MTREEFHMAFNELANGFPLTRLGDTVEASWYSKFQPYSTFRVKAAFNLLAMENRFPTLGAAFGMVRDMAASETSYVMPEFGFCYKTMLGDGKVRCGCSECRPDAYQAHAKKYHGTYGRWPWENPVPGKIAKMAEELAANPGGREGFNKFVSMISKSKRDGFQRVTDAVNL